MRVAIVGGHGKIALHLTRLLTARSATVVSLIRNPAHAEDIRAVGGEPVVCDIEHASVAEIADAIGSSDAVVFAAGAGPGSSAARKLTVDRDGAIKLLEASVSAEVPRYLIISSVGAEAPPEGGDVFSVYLRAKAEADAAVQASDRDWTIVRPGRLTDDAGHGRVRIDTEPYRGEIAREDVASVLDALLQARRATHLVLYVNGGEDRVQQAVEQVTRAGAAPAGPPSTSS
jgi:nucleoside-diphosphate-sugar epimerase